MEDSALYFENLLLKCIHVTERYLIMFSGIAYGSIVLANTLKCQQLLTKDKSFSRSISLCLRSIVELWTCSLPLVPVLDSNVSFVNVLPLFFWEPLQTHSVVKGCDLEPSLRGQNPAPFCKSPKSVPVSLASQGVYLQVLRLKTVSV